MIVRGGFVIGEGVGVVDGRAVAVDEGERVRCAVMWMGVDGWVSVCGCSVVG